MRVAELILPTHGNNLYNQGIPTYMSILDINI
jgi:hypothetical protein